MALQAAYDTCAQQIERLNDYAVDLIAANNKLERRIERLEEAESTDENINP